MWWSGSANQLGHEFAQPLLVSSLLIKLLMKTSHAVTG